jgi:hypothetical protein
MLRKDYLKFMRKPKELFQNGAPSILQKRNYLALFFALSYEKR